MEENCLCPVGTCIFDKTKVLSARRATAEAILSKIKIKNASKVSKGAKIRNRYNQVPHLTQDTNGKVTNSQ